MDKFTAVKSLEVDMLTLVIELLFVDALIIHEMNVVNQFPLEEEPFVDVFTLAQEIIAILPPKGLIHQFYQSTYYTLSSLFPFVLLDFFQKEQSTCNLLTRKRKEH